MAQQKVILKRLVAIKNFGSMNVLCSDKTGTLLAEAYVIRHDHDEKPLQGTVIGRLADDNRTLADIDSSPEELLQMEKFELEGTKGGVRYD
jgi:magnesium-transporting ATPase (P-type)